MHFETRRASTDLRTILMQKSRRLCHACRFVAHYRL